jgi:hexosaminidase
VPWKFHPRNSKFEPSTTGKQFIKHITLSLNTTDSPNVLKPLAGEIDESYSLTLNPSGDVSIDAASSIGLVHGLTTFTQLFYKHSKGGVYTPYAPVTIQDAPKFVHRGINMDVARNWFYISDIKRMIDAASYNKFNRFHLHITDGQSWPLEIPALPELSAKGAYRSDLTYNPAQLRDLQHYGALQGVEVYLEIDMPGHTSSIWYSNPELIASFNKQPNWDTYAAEPPSGTLKLNSTKVYDFLTTLFTDLLPRVSTYSAYFHTGGDEVNVNAYLNDETIASNDSKIIQPYMQKFVDHNHDLVRKAGLTPIVWEEMLLTWNVTMGKDVIVQTWQSDEAVAQTVAKGHKALVGNYNYWVRVSTTSVNSFSLFCSQDTNSPMHFN